MAQDAFGGKPFGLRELKVRAYTGGMSTPLPAAMKLKFTERVQSAELKGDDVIASVVSLVEGAEFEIEGGGIDLAVYAIMTGPHDDALEYHTQPHAGIDGQGRRRFPLLCHFRTRPGRRRRRSALPAVQMQADGWAERHT